MDISFVEEGSSEGAIHDETDLSMNVSIDEIGENSEQFDVPCSSSSSGNDTKSRKIYKCGECTYSSFFSQNVGRHRRAVHMKSKHACDTCGAKYAAAYDLREHVRVRHGEEKLLCEQCSETFQSRKSLSRHRADVHSLAPKFQCTYCGKGFNHKGHFYGHINSHAKSKPYACTTCTKSFAYKSSLCQHTKNCGGNSNKLQCDECNKMYASSTSLRDHKQGVHGPKTKFCGCGKAFKWRSALSRHMKTCSFAKRK